MRYAKIRSMDISNGDGIGVSVFTQGCHHCCKNCFNADTWDFRGGKDFTKEVEDKFIQLCKKPHIDHISVLGGEPFLQNRDLLKLINRIKLEVEKPIWVWTGYTYEELLTNPFNLEIIKNIDVLIDGKFVEELKDLNLKYCGSTNQRVIDVQETLKQNKIIIKE